MSEQKITMRAVAYIKNERHEKKDDFWGQTKATIRLADDLPTTAFDGISAFSHLEIIFYFHKVNPKAIKIGSRHPRNQKSWPKVGTFSQRNKSRPNLIGTTIVKLLAHNERELLVEGLDAINDTPILDIKPIFKEFLPNSPILQADWSVELMKDYFR
ncbi:MAG: SAM-dependent methyltransferase [Chitinophagales bacterium]